MEEELVRLEEQLAHAEKQITRAVRGGPVEYGGDIMWLMMYADWYIETMILQEKIDTHVGNAEHSLRVESDRMRMQVHHAVTRERTRASHEERPQHESSMRESPKE